MSNKPAIPATVISQANFNTILLHAEKISNGQFDFIQVLREELKNKLGIEDADKLINFLKTTPAEYVMETRLFLAQFNFVIEGEGVNYRLVKLNDNYCELDIIKNTTEAQKLNFENLPAEIRTSRRFFLVDESKRPLTKDWSNPKVQKSYTEINGLAGFDTTGHGAGVDYLFLDFDHVLDEGGEFVNDSAAKFFDNFKHTLSKVYVEKSISGRGLHAFLNPSADKFKPINAGKKGTIYFSDSQDKDAPKLELFYQSKGRYCLVTGNKFIEGDSIPSGDSADNFLNSLLAEIKKAKVDTSKKETETNSDTAKSDPPEYIKDLALAIWYSGDFENLERADWLPCISALKNLGFSKFEVRMMCENSKRYDEAAFDSEFDSLTDIAGYGIETLIGKNPSFDIKAFKKDWYAEKASELVPITQARVDPDNVYFAKTVVNEVGDLIEPENFRITKKGVFKISKQGANCISRQPVIIKSKFYGVDSKIYKLVLAYKTGDKWRELPPTERLNIFNAKKLIELTNYGLPVHTKNAPHLADFLDAFFVANEKNLPLTLTTQKFGWQEFDGKDFFLDPRRNSAIEHNGKKYNFIADSDNRFSKALTSAGTIDEWRRVYNLAKKSQVARFMVAASVAAPLLKVLGERNFLIHVFTNTRAGKTTALNLGLSAVGTEKLMLTFDATKNGLLGAAAAANDYLFAVDEKQAADQNILKQIMNFVYAFGGGTGRAKLRKDSSLRDIDEWRGICITTGETELLDDNATGGAHTRLLQIAAPAEILPADICADIRQTVKKNYGLALPLVIEKIFEIGTENLREIFQKLVAEIDNHCTDFKQNKIYLPEHQRYIAVVTIADWLLNLSLGVDDVTARSNALANGLQIFDLIPKKIDISDAEREKDFVIGFIAEKSAHFEGSEVYNKERGLDCYGRSADEEEYTFLTVSALQILCKDKALDYKKVIADLVRENFFVPSEKISNGHATAYNFVQKKINGKNTNCFRIPNSFITSK